MPPESAAPLEPARLTCIKGRPRITAESPGILEIVREQGKTTLTVGACGVIRRIEFKLIPPISRTSAQ